MGSSRRAWPQQQGDRGGALYKPPAISAPASPLTLFRSPTPKPCTFLVARAELQSDLSLSRAVLPTKVPAWLTLSQSAPSPALGLSLGRSPTLHLLFFPPPGRVFILPPSSFLQPQCLCSPALQLGITPELPGTIKGCLLPSIKPQIAHFLAHTERLLFKWLQVLDEEVCLKVLTSPIQGRLILSSTATDHY